ncbi:heterokaryon incompatibility protein-domain-containing protein [Neofusicoccum parvum]|uniref:Heterokaryon incompatibility protein-domain-containing protein n=1 Tax=Neofusicoccum parvum TaxID=310453 RepID=A0ACB5S3G8_9PEZI|nr:heterokaryon incompatibility protein-domain-containing protein [Neofusicoccum parvum]
MSLARRVAGALAKRRTPDFEYSALKTPTSIRLVQLSPKTDDYLIHCTLIEVDLSTNPSYEALSYTWAIDSDIVGPRTGATKRTIMCNGAALDVFKNLHNGLAQLQELGWTAAPIWIDAICINQGDDVEKSAQVNMMGDIFRAAARVVVWLGQSSLATELALKKARPFFSDEELPDDVSSAWAALSSRGAALVALEALSWVLSRGWFARVWTLQEAVLARDTVYLVGAQQVPFDQLLEHSGGSFVAVDGPSKYMDGMFAHMRARVAGLDFARRAHELLAGGDAVALESAVTEARSRRAVDGRDKLFGVLSLCRSHGSDDAAGLAADYQKPVRDVFCECAAALLRNASTGISLLSMVGQIRHGCDVEYAFPSSYIKLFRPEGGFVTGLPSWVPDLSAPARPLPLRDLSTLDFAAATSLEPSFSIAGAGRGVLRLKAAVLDTVTATGDCRSTRLIQPIWRLLRVLFKLPDAPQATYAPTGEPVVSAFWRTLAAGATHAAPDDDENEVELTDRHFVEWFAIFAEETYTLSEGKMRAAILQDLDADDPDLAAEPDDRRRRTLWDLVANEKDSEMLDRYKIHAIRKFLASFDSPAYGFREVIRRRHERLKAMSRVDVEVEQKLWTSEDPAFEDVFEKFYVDRRIFATEKGYMGTAPWTAAEGDVVMLVAGAYVPYVFRRSNREEEAWELVGEAYCHGFMFGEGMEMEGVEFRMIDVV